MGCAWAQSEFENHSHLKHPVLELPLGRLVLYRRRIELPPAVIGSCLMYRRQLSLVPGKKLLDLKGQGSVDMVWESSPHPLTLSTLQAPTHPSSLPLAPAP